ncbi:MAG TPA: TRAP transporter large permease [Alphaproteobacteria bacterium]|jgi:tripartite ATP-independent transporter DctM subunit|nr:TRAP transporter large permease [Alphaproteobacteria bacterium]MDP6269463.1 TRAP transporter large permease [Alphaproteobacteria bacterium]HJM50357.1 TRAP transporter large permease [Alphaproteobacteria bacterium]
MTASLIGLAAVLGLALLRVPIAFAMGLVGFAGFGLMVTWSASLAQVAYIASDAALDYGLSVVPLFILMGGLVARARLSDDLFAASNAFLGHYRGGLAMATVVACAGFGAICGSSVATAATMAKVAMPSMRRYGYADSLAAGSIAAGGTLGILIPPSILLVIYGLLTEESIGRLFAAGILPGLVAIACYALAVRAVTRFRPEAGPAAERTAWPERLRALRDVWGVLVLFALVMGGIYGGIFTPTEAAGIGAVGALALALLRRTLDWRSFFEVLADSAYTTAMLFMVLIGALVFANFVNAAGLPAALKDLVTGFSLSPWVVIWTILVIYIVLGCVFESISMVLLTVPIFFPLVADLGFDMIWFGIIVVCVTELSLITPPVGINIFVLRAVLPDVSTATLIRGVLPFCLADVVRLAILVHIPWLSTYLPSLMFR